MTKGYRLGLALSGGGLRGAVHLGVLKALEKNDIYPDIIAGTSSGSIVGAVYAAGVDFEPLVAKFEGSEVWELLDPTIAHFNWILYLYYRWIHRPMTLWKLPMGFFKGDKLESYMDDILEGRYFKDLKIPLSVVCADVDTGETVVFCTPGNTPSRPLKDTAFVTNQKLSAAVRGSISLPGVFVPKHLGGRRLVDGGVKNNIPVNILYSQGARKVIAVDLGVTSDRARPDSVVELIMASLDIMGDELSRYIRSEYPAYYIYPDLQGVGYKDYDRIREFISFGEEAAQKAMPEIKRYLYEK
jgi:NTE family protein